MFLSNFFLSLKPLQNNINKTDDEKHKLFIEIELSYILKGSE